MYKKLLILHLGLLVSNLSCSDAPATIPVATRAESPVRVVTGRDRIAHVANKYVTIGNCVKLVTVAAVAVVTLSSPHDCCATKSSYLDTTSSKVTFPESPYIDHIIDHARVLALRNHPGFGDPAKFRVVYPDYRPEVHPEHGDICESIPNSNYTIVCYNQLKTVGSEKCIAEVIRNYLKTRSATVPLGSVLLEKRLRDVEQAGKDCIKRREFRYVPEGSAKGSAKGSKVRKSGRIQQ